MEDATQVCWGEAGDPVSSLCTPCGVDLFVYLFREVFKSRVDSIARLPKCIPFKAFKYPAELKQVEVADAEEIILATDENLLISGAGGTGKTYLVNNHIAPALCKRHDGKKSDVWLTASTGKAADLIAGLTIHSAAGLQRGKGSAEVLIQKISKTTVRRFRKVKAIVIEEWSMVSATFLELLDEVARRVRDCPGKVYSGVRIILVGDFCQLPPVADIVAFKKKGRTENRRREPKYAFQSETWRKSQKITLPIRSSPAIPAAEIPRSHSIPGTWVETRDSGGGRGRPRAAGVGARDFCSRDVSKFALGSVSGHLSAC